MTGRIYIDTATLSKDRLHSVAQLDEGTTCLFFHLCAICYRSVMCRVALTANNVSTVTGVCYPDRGQPFGRSHGSRDPGILCGYEHA